MLMRVTNIDNMKSAYRAQLNAPLLSLVIANTIPLWGVLFLGWDVFLILVLYWAENVIVGFYNILKIIFAHADRAAGHVSKIFYAAYFVLLYGAFMGGHGLFILVFFGKVPRAWGDEGPLSVWLGPLFFLQLLVNVIKQLCTVMPWPMIFPFGALFISHGVSFGYHFILKKEYASAEVKKLMSEPYSRLVVMHVTIIFGGFLLMLMRAPIALVVALVIVKTVMDAKLYLRQRERRR